MSLYVFALVDRPPQGRPGTGLNGPLTVRRIGEAFAIVERRADVPPAEFGTLARHQSVVTDLASRVPAILPVRFGSLLEEEALEEALSEREDDLQEAFALVRDRVQFTWRGSKGSQVQGSKVPGSPVPGSPVPGSQVQGSRVQGSPVQGSRVQKGSSVRSGAEYLRRAAEAARPAPPAVWKPVRSKLTRLIVEERHQAASGSVPESLYHLVPRDAVSRYEVVSAALRHADPRLTMTGPWPPFAFAPEIL